jgi:hypothetical protein
MLKRNADSTSGVKGRLTVKKLKVATIKPVKVTKTRKKSETKSKVKAKKFSPEKSELVDVAIKRNDSSDPKKWKAMKKDQLKDILLPLSDVEINDLIAKRELRSSLKSATPDELKKTLMAAGLSKGSKYSKSQKIDLIMERDLKLYKPMNFNPDQKALLKMFSKTTAASSSSTTTIIAAGPGSGKTTSLAALAYQLSVDFPDDSILVVMFNRAAEKTFADRIELLGGKAFRSSAAFDPWHPAPGVYCLTLNKLAARIIRPAVAGGKKSRFATSEAYEDEAMDIDDYDDETEVIQSGVSATGTEGSGCGLPALKDQIPIASEILTRRPMRNWSRMLLDEGQDVQGKLDSFVNLIQKYASHGVFGGDPRQEVYAGARFFSSFWQEDKSPTTDSAHRPPIEPIVLRYNHRSHPKIVEALNAFSRFCFPTLHHDQIAARGSASPETPCQGTPSPLTPGSLDSKLGCPARGLGEGTSPSGTPPVEVVTCERMDMALCIASELLKHKPTEIYLMAPISVEKYNMGSLLLTVRNLLQAMGCTIPLIVLGGKDSSSSSSSSNYNSGDQVYYAGGSRKLKGTERKVVIAIGMEMEYHLMGVPLADSYKAQFVTLSRAVDKLLIIIPSDANIGTDSPLGQVIKLATITKFVRTESTGDACGIESGEREESEFKFRHVERTMHRRLITTLRAKDDIAERAGWKSKVIGSETSLDMDLSVLEPLRIRGNEDFAGCYVEALVALKLGADIKSWTDILDDPDRCIKILNRPETALQEAQGTWLRGAARPPGETEGQGARGMLPIGTSSHCLLLRRGETWTNVKAQVEELKKLAEIDMAYVLCVLSYTARVGKWWVASKQIHTAAQTIRIELDTVVVKLCEKLKCYTSLLSSAKSNLIWGKPLSATFCCHRSNKVACQLTGIADLVIEPSSSMKGEVKSSSARSELPIGTPLLLEIKFGVHSDAHMRQTAVYANMLNYDSGLLINLAENRIFEIGKVDTPTLENYGRAQLMIKNGRTHGIGKRIRVPEFDGAVIVSLDVESDGFPGQSPLTETGAMCWYWGTEEVEDSFHRVVSGAKDILTDRAAAASASLTTASRCSGLLATEESNGAEAQKEQKKLTKAWYNKIRGRKVHLTWSCDDFKAAGIVAGATKSASAKADGIGGAPIHIDLRKVYSSWLDLNKCQREGRTTLRDAVEHFCDGLPVRFHSAFDDALATAFVANAIVDFGGTL